MAGALFVWAIGFEFHWATNGRWCDLHRVATLPAEGVGKCMGRLRKAMEGRLV